MIFYKVIQVSIGNDNKNTSVSTQLNLFKGDYGLDIGFELVTRPYKVKQNINILTDYNDVYVDAVIVKPNKDKTTIKNLKVVNNLVVLNVTKALIDQIGEYELQFHIGNTADDKDTSYFTVPGTKFYVNKPIGEAESDVEEVTFLADSEGNVICDENGEYVICI